MRVDFNNLQGRQVCNRVGGKISKISYTINSLS